MSQILNISELSTQDILGELNKGAKFVIFEYCVSVLIITFKEVVMYILSGRENLLRSIV